MLALKFSRACFKGTFLVLVGAVLKAVGVSAWLQAPGMAAVRRGIFFI